MESNRELREMILQIIASATVKPGSRQQMSEGVEMILAGLRQSQMTGIVMIMSAMAEKGLSPCVFSLLLGYAVGTGGEELRTVAESGLEALTGVDLKSFDGERI